MLAQLKNLFWHHHQNNHRPKILHLSSLTFLFLLIIIYQIFLTLFIKVKPGVLGFASSITVDEIVSLTNAQRKSAGLSPLQMNPLLDKAAAAKAAYMFANDFWAHNGPDGTTPWVFFKQVGYNYRYAGENLARDFSESSSVVSAWMNSPTHKDNILSDHYDEVGVAVVNGVLAGEETTLVVQLFGLKSTAVASIGEASAQAQSQISGQAVEQEPLIAFSEEAKAEENFLTLPKATLSQARQELNSYPLLSSFYLTKSLNLALILLVIIVLAIDGWLVWHRKTIRISGKSFIHLSLFALIALLILLSENGQIL